jgi:hypothetical protein
MLGLRVFVERLVNIRPTEARKDLQDGPPDDRTKNVQLNREVSLTLEIYEVLEDSPDVWLRKSSDETFATKIHRRTLACVFVPASWDRQAAITRESLQAKRILLHCREASMGLKPVMSHQRARMLWMSSAAAAPS